MKTARQFSRYSGIYDRSPHFTHHSLKLSTLRSLNERLPAKFDAYIADMLTHIVYERSLVGLTKLVRHHGSDYYMIECFLYYLRLDQSTDPLEDGIKACHLTTIRQDNDILDPTIDPTENRHMSSTRTSLV
jgi:hypothetical protein